jgi:type VI secretion system secreted protein Hcp
VDQFSLNFAKIRFEYKVQKNDGSLEPAITGGWNLKENKNTEGGGRSAPCSSFLS